MSFASLPRNQKNNPTTGIEKRWILRSLNSAEKYIEICKAAFITTADKNQLKSKCQPKWKHR